jgi:hypothetical protein
MSTQRHRKVFKDILEKTILPEGISIEERNERFLPLSKHIVENIPSRLFRYRECSEMNLEAFDENKLFAVTSDKFNDPYDCLFRYDKERLRNLIMMGMSKDVIYSIREHFRAGGDYPDLLNSLFDQEFLNQAKTSILNADDDTIEKRGEVIVSMRQSIDENIDRLTEEAVKTVKLMAFIACFSEDIHSVTMWSHYANSHHGFVLEYDTKAFQLRCQFCDQSKQCNKAAICNLYPVIYQKQRYDATDFLGWYIGRSIGLPIKNLDTFASLKALLYKSPQWSYEKEWRLIVSKMNDFQDKTPVCIDHLEPTAIYYGTRISPINRKMLHLIAKEKGIQEYQMYIDNKSYSYSVKFRKYLE